MPTQADYDKVNSCMIAPICVLFSSKFVDEMIEAFVEDLSGYSSEILKGAFKSLRRECKRIPTLAQVIDYCEAQKKLAKTTAIAFSPKKLSTVFHCMGHVEVIQSAQAKEILESAAGQYALEIGVGRELLVAYEINGGKDFDESDVKKFKRQVDDSLAALREAADRKNPNYEHFLGMFNESQVREKRLYEKYYQRRLAA